MHICYHLHFVKEIKTDFTFNSNLNSPNKFGDEFAVAVDDKLNASLKFMNADCC